MREKFEQFTTADLQEELELRKSEEEQRLRAQAADRARRTELWLMASPCAVDFLVPEHGRTSCGDGDLANGWGSHSDGGFRCLRCALLQVVLGHSSMPEGWQLSLDLVRKA